MKPLIGVVAHTDLNRNNLPVTTVAVAYTAAVEKAGGLPMILPFSADRNALAAMAGLVKGFIFPGGIDIAPALYHESAIPALGQVDEALDRFQLAACALAVEQRKPVLGICRGIQLVNVALGGTLFQDIPSQLAVPVLNHMDAARDVDHTVDIAAGSRLHALFGPRLAVNSRHHQSIKEPGRDLVITARAPDGVIEAAQHRHLPIDLVQWHPERMLLNDDAMLPLFQYLVQQCRLT